MTRRHWASVVLGAILAVSLLSGPTVHALIPHDHGDHHNVGEMSSVWQSLHAALRHDEKSALPVFDMLAVVGVVFLGLRLLAPNRDKEFVDTITNALRRGIFAYRRFG